MISRSEITEFQQILADRKRVVDAIVNDPSPLSDATIKQTASLALTLAEMTAKLTGIVYDLAERCEAHEKRIATLERQKPSMFS